MSAKWLCYLLTPFCFRIVIPGFRTVTQLSVGVTLGL